MVVVNWNGRHLLRDCLGSLVVSGFPQLRLILVDNASQDASVAYVRRHFPQVEVIAASENLRWAGGNNLALEQLAREGWPQEQVLLLNNDTMVPPGCLECLTTALRDHRGAWAATPRIVYADDPARIWYDGGLVGVWSGWVRHEGIRRPVEGRPSIPYTVDYGTGCALLLTRQALKRCGLFDTTYRFYGEDVDYCLRLRDAGGRILHVPGAVLMHKVSASLGASSPSKIYLRTRSHVRLLRCHWPRRRWPVLLPAQLFYLGGHALWHLGHGRPAAALAPWRGLIDEWCGRSLPDAVVDTAANRVVS